MILYLLLVLLAGIKVHVTGRVGRSLLSLVFTEDTEEAGDKEQSWITAAHQFKYLKSSILYLRVLWLKIGAAKCVGHGLGL